MPTDDRTLKILKYIFFGSLGAYGIYSILHKRQQVLQGVEYMDKTNIVDAIMPLVNMNPYLKPLVEKAAKKMVDEFTQNRDIIDVIPLKEE